MSPLNDFIELLTNLTAWLAVRAIVNEPLIHLLNFVISAGIGVGAILLAREALRDERWLFYFGGAYITFAFLYLPRFAAVKGWVDADFFALQAIFALLSAVNNLLFFACARSLLAHRQLLKVFPVSVLAVAFVTFVIALLPWVPPFYKRLLDALFSAFCLLTLGWSIYLNFNPGRRRSWATMNIAGAVFYSLTILGWPLNALIADNLFWPTLKRTILTEWPSPRAIGQILDHQDVLKSLDTSVALAALVFKSLIFLSACLLVMKCITALSPREAQRALASVREGSAEYLTDQGILRALGESVAADLAVLCFRLPGSKADQVIWWRWLRNPELRPDLQNPTVSNRPIPPERSIVGLVLADGVERMTPDRSTNSELDGAYWEFVPGMRAFVTVPLKYHNAVIGCLNLEWKDPQSFNATALQRVRLTADLIAPAVHSRRQLAALNNLSIRLTRLEEEHYMLGSPSFKALLEILFDVLAPASLGIIMDFGFKRFVVSFNETAGFALRSPATTIENLEKELKESVAAATRYAPQINRTLIMISGRPIGHILTCVEPTETVGRFALVGDELHRRAVANLVINFVLNVARRSFNKLLNNLQVVLNPTSDTLTIEGWLNALKDTVTEADLLWIAAKLPQSFGELTIGSQDNLETIAASADWESRDVDFQSVDRLCVLKNIDGDIAKIGTTSQLLNFILSSSKAHLWIAVERANISLELGTAPWQTFLKRLAEAADAALVRIEREHLRAEATRLVQVATRVEVSGLLMHELRNRAEELALGSHLIESSLKSGESKKAQQRAVALKRNVAQLSVLAGRFYRDSQVDGRSKILLVEPIEKVKALYEYELASKRLDLRVDVANHFQVKMPFDVVFLVMTSLMSNALEAMVPNGWVEISAVDLGYVVHCDVTDNGRGIDPKVREQLFSLGASTKGESGGWGLYLGRSALQRCGGNLILDPDSRSGWTRFTIVLPKAAKE